MDSIDKMKSGKYLRAKKRVEELRGFYIHALVYVGINLFITLSKLIRNIYYRESFNESFFDFGTFAIWIFWGIGLAIHAMNVFGLNFLFGKNWQERKIQEFMHKENSKK